MAYGLEVRVPLLAADVVNLVTSLPIDYKVAGTTGKRILRDAFLGVLPEPILGRRKMGFEVPVGENGDNYDRYMVRMREMEQSLRLLEQVAALLPDAAPPGDGPEIEPAEAIRRSRGERAAERIRLSPNLEGYEKERLPGLVATGRPVAVPAKEDTYTTMEGLIGHFLFFMNGKGIRPPKGDVYFSVEGGNGEVGFYIVSDGTDRPYRLHLRAPCFHIVSALEQLIQGRLVADVIPTFGSMNMIGGELDR
jgi:NADH-quinone oxidoreductase subunit D